jgi:holo-ACP synthase
LIDKILEDRENRYNKVLELLEIYKLPVVCGKINYPGDDKNTPESNKAFSILSKLLVESYKEGFIYSTMLRGYDGKSFLGVINMDEFDAKQIGIKIEEEHNLGRIFDIDVYIRDGSSLGREKINIDERKCIVCGDNARICIKSGKHSVGEVLQEIKRIISEYIMLSKSIIGDGI